MSTLEKQSDFNFTGKINILYQNSQEFLGHLYMQEGKIVNFTFKQFTGENALNTFVCAIFSKYFDNIKLVIEPEIMNLVSRKLFWSVNDMSKKIEYLQTEIERYKKLRPLDHLRLKMAPPQRALKNITKKLNKEEEELIKTINHFSLVSKIYDNSRLLEHDTTKVLVSLRTKGLIRVTN